MVLFVLALVILASGFVAQRYRLSPARRRHLVLIGVATTVAVLAFSGLRLGPLAVLSLVIGIGLAAVQVMQEIGRRGTFEDLDEDAPRPRPARSGMDRTEALAVLGLDGQPDEAAILAAHKRMIVRAHPDQGGSDYLAAKVNEAKQVLLPKD